MDYNRNLFGEWLGTYKQGLTLFEDKKRFDAIELRVMSWFEDNGNEFMLKEYISITKRWWIGAKETAQDNFIRLWRGNKKDKRLVIKD